MKRILIAALAASALAVAMAPAHAQPGYGRDRGGERGERGGYDIGQRIEWLQGRIDRGRRDGSLDRREARRAQERLNDIRYDERRMRERHGGHLGPEERDRLNQRLEQLSDSLHWMRHNDERRPW